MAKILQWINYNGTSYELDGVAYAVCSTSGAAATKIADSEDTLNFKLINGAKVVVKFSNAITSGTSSLQIGTTTPKVMKYNGSLIGPGMISNDQVCEFVYDSTEDAWLLVGGTGTGNGDDSSTSLDFRGTIQSNAALPNNHLLGMVYRVGADGVYAGQNCEVGDLIICINEGNSANNSDWTVIQKNVDVALFKGSNAFSDGQLLLADGANGKVKAVDLNPTLTVTNGTVDDGPKIKIAVGGIESSERTINTATTAVYGVTKLSNTPNANEQNLAATPKLVNAAIAGLDFTDTTDATKFVSAVNETDGIVSVSRESFNPSVNVSTGTSEIGPAISVTVAGNTSAGTSIPAATTSVYGVTILDDNAYNSATQASATAMTPKGVWAAINTLDSDLTGSPAASKTFTAFAQTDGKVTGTLSDIAISASQVTSGTLPVERGGTGQTTVAEIQAGKDAAGNTITTTYATKSELNELLNANNAMIFKGTIISESQINNNLTTYKPGDVYRVNAAGTYAGKACEVGDLLIAVNEKVSTFNNNDWIVAQANVDGAVFKGSNSFVDGNMLIADGTTGKVESVAINTTLTKTSSSADDSDKLKVTVGGVDSNEVALSQATTAVYGVTKLTNTPSNSITDLAATPKLVDNAIAAGLANVSFDDTAVSGQYVSEVNQTNGEISVTRANFTPTINKTSSVDENPDYFTISVGGATSSPAVALSTATGAVYGVTKLISDASASNNLYAATPGMVQGAITAKINTLDVSDITAETGKYISAVAEENGLISATKANFNPSINKTSSTSDDPDSFTISVGGATSSSVSLSQATSSVFGVVKLTNNAGTDQNLAATPYAVNAAINNALSSTTYSDTTVTGQYVSEVDQTNGTISVTRAGFNPSVSITPTPLDNPDLTPSIAITVGGASSSEVNLPAATTAVYGVTKLSNATNSQDSTVAASSKAVADKIKRLYLFDYYDETTSETFHYISSSIPDYTSETLPDTLLTESELFSILNNAYLNNELIILDGYGQTDYILTYRWSYSESSASFTFSDASIGDYYRTSLSEDHENDLATVTLGHFSHGMSLRTSNTNGLLQLLDQNGDLLSSVPFNQNRGLYLRKNNSGDGYWVFESPTANNANVAKRADGFIEIAETAIAHNDTLILVLPSSESNYQYGDLYFTLTAREVEEGSGGPEIITSSNPLIAGATGEAGYNYTYTFMSNNIGKIITLQVTDLPYNNTIRVVLYETTTTATTISSILPVSKGGTGVASFTANSIIMSGNSTTSPLVTRPVTDNTTNIAISNNNTNIPTMNTVYYGLATINGNSQHRGINIYAPTDATNAVLNDVAVYNSSTGAAEFKTLATTQVNTGYHFEENQTLDSNTTSGITAKVTTTSNNLGVLELSWISLSSDGAATVATGGFTDNTATAAYADGNVRSW